MNFLVRTKDGLRQVPLIPVRDVVVFPQTELVLTFGRRKSVLAINAALQGGDKLVALFTQQNPGHDDPGDRDLYRVGTLCVIERTLKNDSDLNVLVRGLSRIYLKSIPQSSPYQIAEVAELREKTLASDELEAMARHLTTSFKEAVNLGKPVEFMNFMRLMSGVSVAELTDQIASTLSLGIPDKQQLLETLDTNQRMKKTIDYLARELKVLELEKSIATKTQAKFSKNMKDAVLRERMEMIKKELGEGQDEEDHEIKDLETELKKLKLDPKSRAKVNKELNRYSKMSPHNPEAGYIRTWLDTVLELPWNVYTANRVALSSAGRVLDEDHFGLEEVKERILEYLSVMKLQKKQKGAKGTTLPTILCFVGPPGVGKTSLGRSIARALKRKFVKVSLGGIRDEAEIRGHRRTYVGAMPGRIIDGINTAGSSNPVFMLDEIDKVGNDFRGDPSSALLEALDPEQNFAFSDHYLDLPFDLSQVMFITTANVLDTIPAALRDRLEVIRFSGYTEVEKYHIAKDHLLGKVRDKNALGVSHLKLNKATLTTIIKSYTREAGVRGLERELGKIARKRARALALGKKLQPVTVNNLADFLGPTKYLPTLREKTHPVGMATGLAWTEAGGEILFVEASLMPGKGRLKLTGQLGDVMKESAQAAATYVRSHWRTLKLKKDFFEDLDIHVHVPEGAVPKDGPSAGVTITTALVSALTNKRVKKTLGMTGEITLRGRVLEIGGLKEKVIAAHSAGLREILFPEGNAKDLVKIPEEIKRDLTFHPVGSLDQVLQLALV